MDNILYLSQFNLLNSLSMEDLIEMDELTSITIFPKNTFIQTPETYSEALYYVKVGKVRLYKLNADGKQFTLDILSEGNVFGEMDAISLGTRDMYIEALEECCICMMNKNRFEDFMIQRPRFMMSLIKVMSDRINAMSSSAQNFALGNLQDKILHTILKLSNQFGSECTDEYCKIDLSLSHQEIANLVGATRESVSIALKKLTEEKMIKTGLKTIYIRRDLLSNNEL